MTDYRINDFALLIKVHRLAPWGPPQDKPSLPPGSRAKHMLDRATRVFPLTISSTTIFNMPGVAPLINLLQQEVLSDEGVSDCQKVIYNLIRSVERECL